jgi:predicted Zn-dependent protease
LPSATSFLSMLPHNASERGERKIYFTRMAALFLQTLEQKKFELSLLSDDSLRHLSRVKKKLKPLDMPDSFHLQAAEGWLGLGDVESATNELKEISPDKDTHPSVLAVRYQIFAQAKQWDTAVEVADDLAKMLPEKPFVWINLAYATRRKTGGSIPEAKKILLGAEPNFPKHYLFPYNLACYCSQLGELEQAQQWLKKAAKIDNAAVKKMAVEDTDLKPLWQSMGGTLWEEE